MTVFRCRGGPRGASRQTGLTGLRHDMRHFATNSAELTVNADAVRTEELYGRTHVVAPVTLVREMVLKGELLPFEEIERTAMAWNGSPVTVTHPRDDDGGFLPTSMDAAEFERHATGHVFGAEPDADRRALDGEVYVDAECASETAAALDRDDPAEMLLDGDPVEVSTGYWYRKNEQTGTYEGAEYTAEQRDVQPDHLATLPNGEGECAISDGCGAGDGTDAATAAAASGFESSGQETIVADGGDPKTAFQQFMATIGFGDDAPAGDALETACNCTGDCDCGTADTPTDDKDDTTMDIERLATQTGLDEGALKSLSDDELSELAEAVMQDGDDGEGDTDGGGDTDSGDDEDEETAQSALTRADLRDEFESMREDMTDDMRDVAAEVVAERNGRGRDELVNTIETHANNADAYDLDGMSIAALEGLAEDVAPSGGMYAGRAGAAGSDDDDLVVTGLSLDDMDDDSGGAS